MKKHAIENIECSECHIITTFIPETIHKEIGDDDVDFHCIVGKDCGHKFVYFLNTTPIEEARDELQKCEANIKLLYQVGDTSGVGRMLKKRKALELKIKARAAAAWQKYKGAVASEVVGDTFE